MVSYIIQGVVTMIFGPVLALLALIFDSNLLTASYFDVSETHWMTQICIDLAGSTHQANMILATAVMTASLIRLQQIAPLAEVSFITFLTVYEFLIAQASFWSYVPIYAATPARYGSLWFYMVACIAMFFAIVGMRKF